MYEFHGIRWENDSELDPDSPERRGPGWVHAYVPVIGPDGEATGTAHVPIYMPRIFKELKRFALQVFRAAGGRTTVEASGWWDSIKKGFKKMAKVVAKNKALRAVAQQGLEAAVPGGPSVTPSAMGVLEELVSKYRGGSTEAAQQIKGILEAAQKGSDKDTKILDALRREYTKQQTANLPALMQTMSSGMEIVYDPEFGAKRKMSKKQRKRLEQQRKRSATARRRVAKPSSQSKSPLRNSPQGPQQPGMRAQQLRQGTLSQQQMTQAQYPPGYDPYGSYGPYAQYPQYQQQYQQPYPQGYYPEAYGPAEAPEPYYESPEDAEADQAELEEAYAEQMARWQAQMPEDEEEAISGYKPSKDEFEAYKKLSPEERQQLKKMGKKEGKALLAKKGFERKQSDRKREVEKMQRLGKAQQKLKEMQRSQIDREKRRSLIAQAKLRYEEQKKEAEERVRNLEDQLYDRDMADEKRQALQAQKRAYESRLADADKNLLAADLEDRKLEYAHREAMAKIRASMPQIMPEDEPMYVDEETSQELDMADPLVREAVQHMQEQAMVDEDNEE